MWNNRRWLLSSIIMNYVMECFSAKLSNQNKRNFNSIYLENKLAFVIYFKYGGFKQFIV